MLKKLIFLIIICLSLEAKIHNLDITEVKIKTEEILKTHANYKKVTSTIAERILKNFIDELDPNKIYFIESDIQNWLYPSEEVINEVIESFKSNNFFIFDKIHQTMEKAIKRRNQIEIELENSALPQNVNQDEFKNMTWCNSKRELLSRLLKIKALQIETAKKIDKDSKSILIKKLNKRRLIKEAELCTQDKNEHKSLILSNLLKAFCHSLDSHTDYFTPFEANQFLMQVQQKLSGIGAQLRDNLNGFSIVHIIDKSPAQRANLKIEDRIIAVNKESVIGMDIIDVVELIRGEKGSDVTLTIARKTKEKAEETFDVIVTRKEVVLEETRIEKNYEPFGDGIIANIKLFSFYQDAKNSSAGDLKNAIEDFKKNHKVKAVLLDLRSNTGGLLPQAVEVASLFISKGIVVSIKDCFNNIQHFRNTDGKPIFEGPLVVLINQASASASEIVAGTLQDYGRAIIVGDTRSFGKGSFQTFTLDPSKNVKINSSGEYKVTRGKYYTVSGKSPQLTGIKSDIVIPGILSELEIGEQFSKYPLENDQINPNFEDDLSDIPFIHRKRISLLYKHNMQQKIAAFTQYLNILFENSKNRLIKNKAYQNFLKEIKKKNFESESVEFFGQNDLQMQEALNITKDLTYLTEINDKQFD